MRHSRERVKLQVIGTVHADESRQGHFKDSQLEIMDDL